MFIQLKDINRDLPTDSNVFILHTKENEPSYISRSFASHDVTKYTSTNIDHSIVYFNRQAAVNALKTDFYFTDLLLDIKSIPVNSEEKEKAKKADSVKRLAKIKARKERNKWN